MIDRLARGLARRNVAWAVVLAVLLLASGGLVLSVSLEHEDDLLAFLPASDPQVQLFHDLNRRFGGLDVALVGIADADVFAPAFLSKMMQLTRDLDDTPGLDRVLTLTNIVDFVPDPVHGGIITGPLIDRPPRNDQERAAVRTKVLSRDHVVGNLVDTAGQATLVYCFLAHGSDPRQVAARIQRAVSAVFAGSEQRLYWGGGPFISTYIYDTTQRDMRRLTPWAVLAMVLVMTVAFRDLRGTCLALLSTSFGIVFSLGLMSLLGVRVNLALSSMPVILLAVGSAYSIHILARYYALTAAGLPNETAVRRTVATAGPTVLAAGLTTVVSLLSFVTTDLRPMRAFGLFTAIGVLATLVLALTFIPAVIRLTRLRAHHSPADTGGQRLLEQLTTTALRQRLPLGLALALLAVVAAVLTLRVNAQIEMSNLFSRNSPPDRSERFMGERFGGSQFLWVHVAGDMSSPEVLREVQFMADSLALLPNVTAVMHVADALSRANEAMEGLRRLPDTRAKAGTLHAMMAGDPSVGQLITRDRQHALIQVKVRDSSAAAREELLQRVERWIASSAAARTSRPESSRALERVEALSYQLSGKRMSEQQRAVAHAALQRITSRGLAAAAASQAAVRAAVVDDLRRFLRSDECAVNPPPDLNLAMAGTLAALGPGVEDEAALRRAIAGGLGQPLSSQDVDDLLVSVGTPLQEIWQRAMARFEAQRLLQVAKLTIDPNPPLVPRARARRLLVDGVAAALLDLRPAGATADDRAVVGALQVGVNGMPVLHRALSDSALGNQLKSLGAALLPVILIMALLFRSLRAGLLVASPTLLTLLTIYGGMGLFDVRLDLGTSMLACIILGAGVDYAVHLVAGWHSPGGRQREAAARAVRHSGVAIWTNALMVAIGFGVLTLGEAKPLQNVGGLTAVAMIVAATATFLIIPVLARRADYGLVTLDQSATASELDEPLDREAVAQPSSASGRE